MRKADKKHSCDRIIHKFLPSLYCRVVGDLFWRFGKIDSDGAVRDRNNMVVGYAKGVSKTYAAVFFFFDLFQK